MATTDNETLTELERRAETTRSDLAHTLDALHNRISPDAIKSDMRSYARDTSQQMMQTVEAKIRENPLEAMAVAVGLAYPLWRLLGRVPAPVLMIGAGLAMSRRNGSGGTARPYRASRDDYVSGDAYTEGRVAADGHGSGALSSIKEKASSLGSQIAEKAHETMESVRGYAASTAHSATDFVSERYEGGRSAASEAAETVSRSYERTRESLSDAIERHPLLVGGIAFAAGTLLASALPVTRQENRLMGSSADEIKRRTQGMAQEGLDQAKTAAREVYRAAAADVREEGLTPEVARKAVRQAVEKGREAVEHTVSGETRSDGQPDRSLHNL